MLTERPISAKNDTTHLILDMTKAFDNTNRNLLIENLKDIDTDDLHLTKSSLDVKLGKIHFQYKWVLQHRHRHITRPLG